MAVIAAEQYVAPTEGRSEAMIRRFAFDGWLLVTVVALVTVGVVMVFSSSIHDAYQFTNSSTTYLDSDVAFVVIGCFALVLGASIKYTWWRTLSLPIAALSLLALVAVFFAGTSARGAQRWFALGPLSFQPSEVAKIALAVYFAHWLSNKGDKIREFGACTAPFGMMLGLVCVLVLIQPDLGTTAVIALAMVSLFYVAGARVIHLAAGVLTGLALAAIDISAQPYQMLRIEAWLHPWKYANTASYHATQALYALGLGGVTGVGLGHSQQKYNLPAPYTDSIFAITAEELGFLGAICILALFALFAYRGFRIAQNAPDGFGRLLAVGITTTIVIQAFMNIAVITSSVPFTGVPLPFVSYGGSSLVMSMFGVGILLSISSHRGTPNIEHAQQKPRPAIDGSRGNHGRKDRRARSASARGGSLPASSTTTVRRLSHRSPRTGAGQFT